MRAREGALGVKRTRHSRWLDPGSGGQQGHRTGKGWQAQWDPSSP